MAFNRALGWRRDTGAGCFLGIELAYHRGMSKKRGDSFQVECPCCQAKLVIDGELEVVLSHTAPPRPPSSVNLDDTARLLRQHDDAVEAKFRASVEAERSKEDVLSRKFAEGLKKAKDGPIEKPFRDFDLD